MKKKFFFSSPLLFLLIASANNVVFAASYPASCPKEAQSIVEIIGGCSAVNKNKYSAVYDKCCAKSAPVTPSSIRTPITVPAPAPAPTVTPVPQPEIKPVSPKTPPPPPKKLPPLKYSQPFLNWPYFSSATQTQVQESTGTPQLENKPLEIVRDGIQKTFNRLLRFFRFR